MNEANRHRALRLSASTKEKLKDAGVAVVYFFGSRATDHHLSFSDIDIGIVMDDTGKIHDTNVTLYERIYDIISTDIPDAFNGPKLDISFLQKANPALAMKAIHEGEILFESSAVIRADFEELTFRLYNDYLKLQREYQEANLKAFE
jgi:predicted nucleotidyltransferase